MSFAGRKRGVYAFLHYAVLPSLACAWEFNLLFTLLGGLSITYIQEVFINTLVAWFTPGAGQQLEGTYCCRLETSNMALCKLATCFHRG